MLKLSLTFIDKTSLKYLIQNIHPKRCLARAPSDRNTGFFPILPGFEQRNSNVDIICILRWLCRSLLSLIWGLKHKKIWFHFFLISRLLGKWRNHSGFLCPDCLLVKTMMWQLLQSLNISLTPQFIYTFSELSSAVEIHEISLNTHLSSFADMAL